jgi:hypothetical protein
MNPVNSIYIHLIPDKARELYKIPYSPLSELIFQRHGLALLACTLPAYCLLFQETSVETAVGVSTNGFFLPYNVVLSLTFQESRTGIWCWN